MNVEVLFFSQVKEALGTGRETVHIAEGGTVRDVVAALSARPEWKRVASLPLSYAVNEEVVDEAHALHEGDRVALLTPVSGG